MWRSVKVGGCTGFCVVGSRLRWERRRILTSVTMAVIIMASKSATTGRTMRMTCLGSEDISVAVNLEKWFELTLCRMVW